MIGEDSEIVSKQILPPLSDCGSDDVQLVYISGGILESGEKWLTEEHKRVTLLCLYSSHSDVGSICFHGKRQAKIRKGKNRGCRHRKFELIKSNLGIECLLENILA